MVGQENTHDDARDGLAALEFDRFARCYCERVKISRSAVKKVYKASQNAEIAKIMRRLQIPKLAGKFGE